MVTMSTTERWLPRSRPLTRADLESMPDDGHRYELIDGVLVVTPAPRFAHQEVVGNLHLLLRGACPPGTSVVLAPFAIVLADDTEMQPDLLVARTADFTERDLPQAPILAVEVSSPSTRLFDLNVKKARFDEAGIEAYWVIDPGDDEKVPRLRAWERRDGDLVAVAEVTGDDVFATAVPFPLEVVPSLLRQDQQGR